MYNSGHWLNVYGDALKVIGIFNKGNELIGSFNLYYGSKLGQQYIITPPYSTDIGLSFKDNTNTTFQKHKLYKNILDAIAAYLSIQKVMFVDIVMPDYIKDIQPFVWKKFEGTVKYTYLLELSQSEKQLLENMSPERRKNIKDAEKEVEVFLCNDLKLATLKIKESLTENKAHFNAEIVDNILSNFPKSDNHICVGTRIENQLSSIHFITKDESMANYIFGWNDKKLSSKAGTFGLWNCILEAKKEGVKTFNFAGSAIPSIEKYFRGFGGELTSAFVVKKQNLLGKAILNLKG